MEVRTFEHALGGTMAAFVALLLLVMPGGFLMFLLPSWLGFPLAVGVSSLGGFLMLKLSDDVNGTSFLCDSDGPRMVETNEDSARGEAGPARAAEGGIAQGVDP